MSNIVNELVEDYIREIIPKNEGFLKEMEIYANDNNIPIIQPEVAKLLEIIIKAANVKSILEVGTAIGYSSCVFLNAMGGKGKVVTIEIREDMYNLALNNIKKFGYEDKIEVILGDGREVLKKIDEKFDMIFLDAAKGHYLNFLLNCFNKVKDNGLIISDNVLYKGMIASNKYVIRRKITIVKRMRKYLEFISNHPLLDTSIIPIGDGLAISYKKGSEIDGENRTISTSWKPE